MKDNIENRIKWIVVVTGMSIWQIMLPLGCIAICLLGSALNWFVFRPHYSEYKDALFLRPFIWAYRIKSEGRWRLAWAIESAALLTIALLILLVLLLGGF